jgi:hypothetical protein
VLLLQNKKTVKHTTKSHPRSGCRFSAGSAGFETGTFLCVMDDR